MHTNDPTSRSRPPRRLLTTFGVGWVLAFALAVPVRATPTAEAQDSALLVLAAASLADVLPQLALAWERTGGAPVAFSFSATSRAATQAVRDPTADVIVSADLQWVEWLRERGAVLAGTALEIASNDLVAIVPAGASGITSAEQLGGVTRIALAGENVPAGRYARSALEAHGVWAEVEPKVVRSGSVRGTLEWVARGEVSAGVVYRTDALQGSDVALAFVFDSDDHPHIGYWAAPLVDSDVPDVARAFVAFLASTEAADVFEAEGFQLSSESSDAEQARSGSSLGGPGVGSAIRLSVIVALLATLVGLVPAIGLGWVLARWDFRGKSIVSALVLAPLVLPPVVTGFLLLSVLGTNTSFGGALASLGLPVPFTLLGAALAAFVVGMPLYVISIRGAFEVIDSKYEELSSTLGATPRRTFLRISLPLALPGIAAGAVLAFARALGEFGATVVLAGNVEGSTRTIALAVYTLLESPQGQEQVWILVGASVAVSLLALFGFEVLSRRQKQRLEDRHGR